VVKRVIGRRTTVALILLLATPAVALAGRRAERRRLPAGARAQAPVTRSVSASAEDPALAAAVKRLGEALAPPAPRAAERQRGTPEKTYVARTASGHVRALMAPPGRVFSRSRAGDTDPEAAALGFLREHRVAFGWSGTKTALRAARSRSLSGRTVVRFEQRFAGLPVFGAGVAVQVDSFGGVTFVLADLARDGARMFEREFPTVPTVLSSVAVTKARDVLSVRSEVSDLVADPPELVVYEPSVIGRAGPSQIAWRVRVWSPAARADETVLVDASSGEVAFHYSNVRQFRNRKIYDANNVTGSSGTLARAEGDPLTGIADVDQAYDYFGDIHDFLLTRFGRDSFDGRGGDLVARVRYCPSPLNCSVTTYDNAYWQDSEILAGDGYAVDDVLAHEFWHGITERTSNLIYWGESGAIDEGLGDIFGEFVDLTNGAGNDTPAVRWSFGEDLPGGAIRSFSNPPLFGDPDRRFSPNWYTGDADSRGVHYNSGVARKLAFLLTDGGTFNGETVAAQGLDAVARLFYEVEVSFLMPASDYYDLYAALRQAALNLGWTGPAFEAVEAACRAVEIDLPGATVTIFSDGFEGAFPGSWQVFDDSIGCPFEIPPVPPPNAQWGRSALRKASGAASAYSAAGGLSPVTTLGPYKPCMDTWMIYGPFSLSSVNEAWAEFDLYLDIEFPFDEIFWGVSTDGFLFDGYVVSSDPDGYTTGVDGIPGWAHELFNFGEIPFTLGEPQVWIGFQFYSDYIVEYEGAYLDNVVIRTAIPQTSDLAVTKSDGRATVLPGEPVVYTVQVSNLGPDAVAYARVIDAVPAALLDVGWTCSATSGSSCGSPGGNGDIDEHVSLLAGGSATFTVFGTLDSGASGSLVNTATASVPNGFTDAVGGNDSATDTDAIGTPSFLMIDDVSAAEEDSGTSDFTFTVTLAPASTSTVTVSYATVRGSATPGVDYTSASGVLTFLAGVTSQPIVVPVVGDTLAEPDETFYVQLSGAAGAAIADSPGVGTILDDDGGGGAGSGLPVELVHGLERTSSLASLAGPVADEELYLLSQKPYASYEAVVDEISGDVQPLGVDRLDADGTTILQSAQGTSAVGAGRSLRWVNGGATSVSDESVRVRSGGCTTACGSEDTYRLRFYETTCSIPRFNNAATQITVLILQNPGDATIAGTVYFWSSAGSLLGSSAISLSARSTLVLNTSTVSGVSGQSGAITIAHDGRYGELSGKTVALEPATGFSFDSPMLWRAVR